MSCKPGAPQPCGFGVSNATMHAQQAKHTCKVLVAGGKQVAQGGVPSPAWEVMSTTL